MTATPQPESQRVAADIRARIQSGELTPGALLPSEREFMATYDIGKATVAKVIARLRAEGLVESQRGRGTFVRAVPAVAITLTADNYRHHQQTGQASFNAQVREQGRTPRQEVIEVTSVQAPSETAARLDLVEGATVLMRRLRFLVDDVPVMLAQVYYDKQRVAGSKLEQPRLIKGGAHSELRRLGTGITRFVEDIAGARLPNPEEERLLQLPSGVPVVRSIRTAYADDQPVEVLDTIVHGEAITYRFDIEV